MSYPEDDHLILVGKAMWAWSRLEWGMVYMAMEEQDPAKQSAALAEIATKTGGGVVKALLASNAVSLPADLSADITGLVNRRNDLAHSRPASLVEVQDRLVAVEDYLQRLYRWDPQRGIKPEFLTDDWLREFIADCESVSRELQKCN